MYANEGFAKRYAELKHIASETCKNYYTYSATILDLLELDADGVSTIPKKNDISDDHLFDDCLDAISSSLDKKELMQDLPPMDNESFVQQIEQYLTDQMSKWDLQDEEGYVDEFELGYV